MKIGILSFRSFARELTVEEQRLVEEVQALGHEALVIHAMDCSLELGSEGTNIFWRNERFPRVDALIPRARFVDHSEQRLGLLEALQKQGIQTLNTGEAIACAKNKITTLEKMSENHLPIPRTIIVEDLLSLDLALKQLEGSAFVLKPAFGTYGQGILLVKSMEDLKMMAEEMMKASPRILIQEFIEESAGKDTRVFVVAGEVVGAMERQAAEGEFRSNVELGAHARGVEPLEEMKHLALEAVRVLGLDYAGVDLVRSKRGHLILEVNANPGFKTLEKVSTKNIAKKIVEAALLKATVQGL